MLLNQMRCEESDPEALLRNSFYQFQCDRALPRLQVSIFFPFFGVVLGETSFYQFKDARMGNLYKGTMLEEL